MKAIFGLIVVLLAAGPLFAEIDFNNMIRDSLKKEKQLNASMSDILENQSPAAEKPQKNVILKQKTISKVSDTAAKGLGSTTNY